MTLSGYVQHAMANVDRLNMGSVEEWLIERAAKDPALRTMLVCLGVKQAVRDHYSAERRNASGFTPRPEADAPVRATNSQVQALAKRLFWDRWTLFGHQPLREATATDLKHSVNHRKILAEGNLRAARFEEDVHGRLPSGSKKVSEVLTPTKVLEIAKAHKVTRDV